MKILSLFSNIGVAEALLKETSCDVAVANELSSRRASLYSRIYPQTKMICGDIRDSDVFNHIVELSRENHVEIVMATPPCQGVSRAGKQKHDDERNLLILPVIKTIQLLEPRYALIENVPQFIEASIFYDGKNQPIIDLIKSVLGQDYRISVNVVDTKYYEVPQTRQRAIILLSRVDQNEWRLPEKSGHIVSLEEAIGGLPSLDPYVVDIKQEERKELFPNYEEKAAKAIRVSRWHIPPKHILRQVIVMMHTPTGKSAIYNEIYYPQKKDGSRIKAHHNNYRRMRWDAPSRTITMFNGFISTLATVHPGREYESNGEILYSDPRALSIYELMIVMSIPTDWAIPEWVDDSFLRAVIGEGIPSKMAKDILKSLIDQLILIGYNNRKI